ncbi:hypothetical protein [Zobellella denitrificans]
MAFFSNWFKPAGIASSVGIYLTQDSLFALDEHRPDQLVQRTLGVDDSPALALLALINAQGWQGRRLHLVLSRHWYQQTQMEKPAMPDEELPQALPWLMRELVSEPVDALLFDYIELPPSPQGLPRIAVYYCARERLAALVKALLPLCDIATIGVDELAMVNLLDPEVRGMLLHKVPGQELTLILSHQHQWQFSRTIRGFQALDDTQAGTDQFVFDNLLLELQRSIDYAVGQLKLNTPNRWYLALPQRVTPAVQTAIGQVFDIRPESLISDNLSPIGLPALGILRAGALEPGSMPRSRIEFYQSSLKPSRERPTPAWLARGALALLLMWGLIFAYGILHNRQLERQNHQLREEVAVGEAELAQLQQELALLNRGQDGSQRQRLEQDIRARQRLLGVLERESFLSYAAILRDLTRIPRQGVALRGITLSGKHMILRGEAARGAAVPAWILGFEQSDSLRDHAFGRLEISQQSGEGWDFTLYSEGVAP